MLASPRTECASVEHTIADARAQRVADVLAAKIESGGQAVDLQRDPVLERDGEHALEVERVLGPAGDEPARRMAEAAHVGIAQRRQDTLRHLGLRHPLSAVDARLHPVELGQDVVGKIEPAVGQDVAFDPAQDAEGREDLVGRRDLLGLPADVVGGEPADGADGGRVVADRDVLVAALDGGAPHLLDARPSVGPRGVAMQVAANAIGLHQRRGLAPERLLAQLRRTPGHPERLRRRRPRPAHPAAARARRRTPARRSRGRAPSRRAAARRR